MKRFYFGDDEEEDKEDEDLDFEEANQMFPDVSELIALTRFDNPAGGTNILEFAIRICEKSFLWKFYGSATKMKMIEETFAGLKKLTEEGIEDAEI